MRTHRPLLQLVVGELFARAAPPKKRKLSTAKTSYPIIYYSVSPAYGLIAYFRFLIRSSNDPLPPTEEQASVLPIVRGRGNDRKKKGAPSPLLTTLAQSQSVRGTPWKFDKNSCQVPAGRGGRGLTGCFVLYDPKPYLRRGWFNYYSRV